MSDPAQAGEPDARLRLLSPDALSPVALEPWFAEAWAAMYAPAPPLVTPTAGDWLAGEPTAREERRVIAVDGAARGIVAYRLADGALVLTALAVAAEARNQGLGSQAVWALEAQLGTRETWALFPRGNGYAFYFWLRTGYRPLFAHEHGRDGFNVVRRDTC